MADVQRLLFQVRTKTVKTLDARSTDCGRGGWGRIAGVAVGLAGEIRSLVSFDYRAGETRLCFV